MPSYLRMQCRAVMQTYAVRLKIASGRVLDVGIAGDDPPGENYKWFGDGNIYETIDIDPQYEPTHIGDICNAPFEDNTFDLVILSNVIEHIWDYRKAINEVIRITKGYAIIDSPLVIGYHAEHNFGDYWRFTADALARLAKEAGAEVIEKVQAPLMSSVLIKKGL